MGERAREGAPEPVGDVGRDGNGDSSAPIVWLWGTASGDVFSDPEAATRWRNKP
jgi:hypothetical protein